MHVKSFGSETDAMKFAESKKADRYIIDGVYPPTVKGGRGIMGRWVVWYH